ncbi:MAG: pentapeptide repeat-containing protein [Pseudonocardiaceae bacterium]
MSDTRASMSAGGRTASNSTVVQHPDFDSVDFSSKDVRATVEEYAGRAILFRRCDFTCAEMQDLDLTGAVFDQCTLNGAELRECVLDRAHIIGGSCVAADFASADVNDAVFHCVELSQTRFTGALLADARFEECRMIGADLTALRGLAATLIMKDCNLQLANFQDTDLRGADLTGSDLTEADLRGTDLRDAVFSRCLLRGVDLAHTRLDGVDLRGADLGEITADMPHQLRGAVISHAQAADICAALGLTVLD